MCLAPWDPGTLGAPGPNQNTSRIQCEKGFTVGAELYRTDIPSAKQLNMSSTTARVVYVLHMTTRRTRERGFTDLPGSPRYTCV